MPFHKMAEAALRVVNEFSVQYPRSSGCRRCDDMCKRGLVHFFAPPDRWPRGVCGCDAPESEKGIDDLFRP